MGAKLGSGGGPMGEINVTPLIDVVLVLLVVFMVVTPMLQSGMPVDLPKATQTTQVNDVGQFIVVSVTFDKGVWVEQDEVMNQEDFTNADANVQASNATRLVAAINREFRKNPSRSILIKGDGKLPYREVRKVMDMIAEQNLTTLLIGAQKGEG